MNQEAFANPKYKTALQSLNSLVLVLFSKDKVVTPKESAWFGFLNGDAALVPLQDQPLYDSLGLKEMALQKKVFFMTLPTEHVG